MATKATKEKPNDIIHIRWMIRRDMPEVLAIEEACFLEFPWNEDAFRSWLKNTNCIGMVAEVDERVVGFMIYEIHRTFINLVNFAVHPSQWRKGVGRRLAERLASKLSRHRRSQIVTTIRATNLDAQLFFRCMGYRATGVNYNPPWAHECDEEGYEMEYRLPMATSATVK